jgi:5-methyltetrahydropteroyltriglutamate--homocysteine methyltransferase
MEDEEMPQSTDRILTTHAGSLPMPADLHAMLRAKEAGQPYDVPALQTRLTRAVAEVVQQQAEHGLDIISDGWIGISKGIFAAWWGFAQDTCNLGFCRKAAFSRFWQSVSH